MTRNNLVNGFHKRDHVGYKILEHSAYSIKEKTGWSMAPGSPGNYMGIFRHKRMVRVLLI